MSDYGIGQLGGLSDAPAYDTYQDADLPDKEEAPERDPEVETESHLSVYETLTVLTDKVEGLQYQNVAVMDRLDTLTGAVNQFGGMLDFVVQSVSQVGKQLSEGGISGIMSMLKGAKSD